MLCFFLIFYVVNIHNNYWDFPLLKCCFSLLFRKQPYTLLFSNSYVFRYQLPRFWSYRDQARRRSDKRPDRRESFISGFMGSGGMTSPQATMISMGVIAKWHENLLNKVKMGGVGFLERDD